ncbi:daptide-type RiPP biosynthesis dehydogenase [Actinacidiphila sp. ITFR-21]|uniref:daptide-type RiPP biosynthesis dehydogenase n=1 Tax=Actinacidiphila sp. ITFR-21 TaxID=3075199 RepID=UPI00288AADF5|nr:daptide-type RiPP biosynthesis dehydogenase [Streptomyces sp. ITFR-21]WNI16179.1 daptide-type RiPP biosynthesis dehydogenase [Streptomyces sp. ITFR-21]
MTPVLHEPLALIRRLSADGTPVALLTDPAVTGGALVARLREGLLRAGVQIRGRAVHGEAHLDGVETLAHWLRGTRAGAVLAVGGGALLDQAKLAAVCAADPEAQRHLHAHGRSGLVTLPPRIRRNGTLAVVPTTLGTGSEISTGACLAGADRKRLVRGAALLPDLVLRDADVLTSLPPHLVREGVLEAFFRATGPYVGDGTPAPGDAETVAVAARLAYLGYAVRHAAADGAAPPPRLLLRIARLSAHSHRAALHGGRDPFAARGWFLANDLSSALGTRKTTAIAALLPPLWTAVTSGDTRWGAADRLTRLWGAVRAATGDTLPPDPATGIARLLADWRIEPRLSADGDRLTGIARRAVHAWGGGLPMLGGLDHRAVRDMLAAATHQGLPGHTGTGEKALAPRGQERR